MHLSLSSLGTPKPVGYPRYISPVKSPRIEIPSETTAKDGSLLLDGGCWIGGFVVLLFGGYQKPQDFRRDLHINIDCIYI